MDAKTEQALEDSIKHWEDNVKAERTGDASDSGADCALCSLFVVQACDGCPVRNKTGRHYCGGSPYIKASYALLDWLSGETDENRQAFQAAAQAELNFLISLRPEKSND